jgi:hypothetical protein
LVRGVRCGGAEAASAPPSVDINNNNNPNKTSTRQPSRQSGHNANHSMQPESAAARGSR